MSINRLVTQTELDSFGKAALKNSVPMIVHPELTKKDPARFDDRDVNCIPSNREIFFFKE